MIGGFLVILTLLVFVVFFIISVKKANSKLSISTRYNSRELINEYNWSIWGNVIKLNNDFILYKFI